MDLSRKTQIKFAAIRVGRSISFRTLNFSYKRQGHCTAHVKVSGGFPRSFNGQLTSPIANAYKKCPVYLVQNKDFVADTYITRAVVEKVFEGFYERGVTITRMLGTYYRSASFERTQYTVGEERLYHTEVFEHLRSSFDRKYRKQPELMEQINARIQEFFSALCNRAGSSLEQNSEDIFRYMDAMVREKSNHKVSLLVSAIVNNPDNCVDGKLCKLSWGNCLENIPGSCQTGLIVVERDATDAEVEAHVEPERFVALGFTPYFGMDANGLMKNKTHSHVVNCMLHALVLCGLQDAIRYCYYIQKQEGFGGDITHKLVLVSVPAFNLLHAVFGEYMMELWSFAQHSLTVKAIAESLNRVLAGNINAWQNSAAAYQMPNFERPDFFVTDWELTADAPVQEVENNSLVDDLMGQIRALEKKLRTYDKTIDELNGIVNKYASEYDSLSIENENVKSALKEAQGTIALKDKELSSLKDSVQGTKQDLASLLELDATELETDKSTKRNSACKIVDLSAALQKHEPTRKEIAKYYREYYSNLYENGPELENAVYEAVEEFFNDSLYDAGDYYEQQLKEQGQSACIENDCTPCGKINVDAPELCVTGPCSLETSNDPCDYGNAPKTQPMMLCASDTEQLVDKDTLLAQEQERKELWDMAEEYRQEEQVENEPVLFAQSIGCTALDGVEFVEGSYSSYPRSKDSDCMNVRCKLSSVQNDNYTLYKIGLRFIPVGLINGRAMHFDNDNSTLVNSTSLLKAVDGIEQEYGDIAHASCKALRMACKAAQERSGEEYVVLSDIKQALDVYGLNIAYDVLNSLKVCKAFSQESLSHFGIV